MTLKILQYCGDALLPEQRSALTAIHPLTAPQITSTCSEDCRLWGLMPNLGCQVTVSAVGGNGCDGGSMCVVLQRAGAQTTYVRWNCGKLGMPESSRLEQEDDSHIALMLRLKNEREMEKEMPIFYIEWLNIFNFRLFK